jgi:hypothetical protein
MLEVGRSNSRQEQLWQFRIEEAKAESVLESTSVFLQEAEIRAAKCDCRVLSVKGICLEYSRGRVHLVVGTAELTPL